MFLIINSMVIILVNDAARFEEQVPNKFRLIDDIPSNVKWFLQVKTPDIYFPGKKSARIIFYHGNTGLNDKCFKLFFLTLIKYRFQFQFHSQDGSKSFLSFCPWTPRWCWSVISHCLSSVVLIMCHQTKHKFAHWVRTMICVALKHGISRRT